MIRSAAWPDRAVDMVAPFPFPSTSYRRTIPLLSTALKPQRDDYRSGADVWGFLEENQNDTLGNTHIEALFNRDVPFTGRLARKPPALAARRNCERGARTPLESSAALLPNSIRGI